MAMYLCVPHVKGAVTEKNYKNWIFIQSFEFSVGRDIDRSSTARTFSHLLTDEIRISKLVDQTSPFFFSEACQGKAITEVKIHVMAAGNPIIEYTLSNVIVSEYDFFIISDNIPLEVIAFNFTDLEVRYSAEKPISSKVQTGSRPSYASQLTRGVKNRSGAGFKLFVATIYGEAASQSVVAWKAIGSVMVNRVGHHIWAANHRNASVESVIRTTGFDAPKKNKQFSKAYAYMKNELYRGGVALNPYEEKIILKMIQAVKPIYYENAVITDANYYYSPKCQEKNHQINPLLYPEKPRFLKEKDIVKVVVPGLSATDDLSFHKRL